MSFKTVLAIVGVSNTMADLTHALGLVANSDTHLSILVVRAAIQPIASDYPIATAWLDYREKEISELLELQRQAEELCRKNGNTYDIDSLYDDHFILEQQFRTRALYADLVVAGDGIRSDADLRRTFVAAVAFDAGTPILLMPDSPKGTLQPKNPLLAWNSKPEAARAAKAALEMLAAAEMSHIVLVDPDVSFYRNGGEPGADIATFLSRHGVNANVEQLASGGRETEAVLRNHAMELGCDMIIMGAYGHSRLRERIFGGVTASIVEQCDIPVFLVH